MSTKKTKKRGRKASGRSRIVYSRIYPADEVHAVARAKRLGISLSSLIAADVRKANEHALKATTK